MYNINVTIRRQLQDLCLHNCLFTDRDMEPAPEWRLYQVQRDRRAESRKAKPGRLFSSTNLDKAHAKIITAILSIGQSSSSRFDAAVKADDPVRDL